jgi:hypothetical protein
MAQLITESSGMEIDEEAFLSNYIKYNII